MPIYDVIKGCNDQNKGSFEENILRKLPDLVYGLPPDRQLHYLEMMYNATPEEERDEAVMKKVRTVYFKDGMSKTLKDEEKMEGLVDKVIDAIGSAEAIRFPFSKKGKDEVKEFLGANIQTALKTALSRKTNYRLGVKDYISTEKFYSMFDSMKINSQLEVVSGIVRHETNDDQEKFLRDKTKRVLYDHIFKVNSEKNELIKLRYEGKITFQGSVKQLRTRFDELYKKGMSKRAKKKFGEDFSEFLDNYKQLTDTIHDVKGSFFRDDKIGSYLKREDWVSDNQKFNKKFMMAMGWTVVGAVIIGCDMISNLKKKKKHIDYEFQTFEDYAKDVDKLFHTTIRKEVKHDFNSLEDAIIEA